MNHRYSKHFQRIIALPALAAFVLACIDLLDNEPASHFIEIHAPQGFILSIYGGILALNVFAALPYIPDVLRGEFHWKIRTPINPLDRYGVFVTGLFFAPLIAVVSGYALYQQTLPATVCFLLAFLPVFSTMISLSFWIRLLGALLARIAELAQK